MSGDYVRRNYRSLHQSKDLYYFNVKIKQTDLSIGVDKASYSDSLVEFTRQCIIKLRAELETYIDFDPNFQHSLVPVKVHARATSLVTNMAQAARACGVGPMAAVAGAVAQQTGEQLLSRVGEVIVENGGDIYMNCQRKRTIAVFAGQSEFSSRIGITVDVDEMPLGICTSSGTVGHSLSFGKADAVMIKSPNAALADAVATRIGNIIQTKDDFVNAIEVAKNLEGITGVLIIKEDALAAWGKIEITPL
ncbi:MAG: UPF0280 family protein [Syntrophomonadaceae bacterium]|jgi:ApbE superfamily uncharacterized protein (UPF0280 family)